MKDLLADPDSLESLVYHAGQADQVHLIPMFRVTDGEGDGDNTKTELEYVYARAFYADAPYANQPEHFAIGLDLEGYSAALDDEDEGPGLMVPGDVESLTNPGYHPRVWRQMVEAKVIETVVRFGLGDIDEGDCCAGEGDRCTGCGD